MSGIERALQEILTRGGEVKAGALARAAGVSRQAAHAHLRAGVEAGRLERIGGGRSTRYRRAGGAAVRHRWPRAILAEDRVWAEHFERHPGIHGLPPRARSIVHYAFTEMLNNAIDHSGSAEVEVVFEPGAEKLAFEIRDEGVGVFANVRRGLRLPSELAALQELSKGKVTTQPARHTGEGIFFTSKIGDRFELESGGQRWLVDNLRGEMTVLEVAAQPGTWVRFEVGRKPRRSLQQVFDAYTVDFKFAKTTLVVKLFEIGTEFVSRSEARRLLSGLERFEKVTLDFKGVKAVGQGFVDEVFRVWARRFPKTKLEPVRMARPVEFMVRRGLG